MPPKRSNHKERLKQEKELKRRVDRAEPVDIVGVVDPAGPSGGRRLGQRDWVFNLTLSPWRIKGGELQQSALKLYDWISERQVCARMNGIKPYSIRRFQARVLPAPAGAPTQGRIVKITGSGSTDRELAQAARTLRKPVYYRDEVLGRLRFDRADSVWKGTVAWKGAKNNRLQLTIESGGEAPSPAALRAARLIVKGRLAWEKKARDYAVKHVLPLVNEWTRRDDPEAGLISKPQFLRGIRLESLTAGDKGTFELWFDDSADFFGHSLVIRGTVDKGPTSDDLRG
ncbi:MAG: hypothetical protein AMXMBFR58_26530 [Phycisphaerae bacterium]|nr:hypothetical protein [Phycisphaerales bacterium]